MGKSVTYIFPINIKATCTFLETRRVWYGVWMQASSCRWIYRSCHARCDSGSPENVIKNTRLKSVKSLCKLTLLWTEFVCLGWVGEVTFAVIPYWLMPFFTSLFLWCLFNNFCIFFLLWFRSDFNWHLVSVEGTLLKAELWAGRAWSGLPPVTCLSPSCLEMRWHGRTLPCPPLPERAQIT